jgi:hypothetical protein
MVDNNWWMGVVEDNLSDTLKINYCKVRIIGIHSRDSSELPTSELPDTLIAQTMDNSFAMPAVGQWVMGVFMDFPNKQQPVATHIVGGLSNNTTDVKLTGAENQRRAQIVNNQPQPKYEDPKPNGVPTTPETARTVGGTLVDYTNKLRKHSCDVSLLVNKAVAQAKQFVQFIIQQIRKGIIAIMKALGFNPGSSALVSFLNDLKRTLKSINNFLKKVVKTIADIADAIRKIRAVIEYILNLPAELLRLFRECLAKLQAILAAAPFEIISGAVGEVQSGIDTGVISSFVEVVQETQQVINNAVTIASAPVQIVDAAYRPSGMSTEEKEKLVSDTYGLSPFKTTNYTTV